MKEERKQIIITQQEDGRWFIRTNWLYQGNEIDALQETPRKAFEVIVDEIEESLLPTPENQLNKECCDRCNRPSKIVEMLRHLVLSASEMRNGERVWINSPEAFAEMMQNILTHYKDE